jgi:hypothetical protein
VAIALGRTATLTVGGAIASVRNVTWSGTARTIDVEEFGVRTAHVYSTGYEAAVSFDFVDSADLDITKLTLGTLLTVSGGAWSFNGVVTSITESQPIDDVISWQVECRATRTGLR